MVKVFPLIWLGELFAISPIHSHNSVEAVLDSSRYFVITVEDVNTKKRAFLGLGFEHRNDAFDFNVTLQKSLRVVPKLEENIVDLSLKEGETIEIRLGNISKQPAISPDESGSKVFSPPPSSTASEWSSFQSSASNWATFK